MEDLTVVDVCDPISIDICGCGDDMYLFTVVISVNDNDIISIY